MPNRIFLIAIFLFFSFVAAYGQNSDLCIIKQPRPDLPSDYGTLDAQVSVLFRVEFLFDGTIGTVNPLKSGFERLTDLASLAVQKIKFIPKKVNGESVTTHKVVNYFYSYTIQGWKVEKLRKCPAKAKPKA